MAKFLGCDCGTVVYLVDEGKETPKCCGETMKELIPHTREEEGNEKHVPLVHEESGKVYVKIGSTLHPMEEDHYIDWVFLLTDKGTQRKTLRPGMKPELVFYIAPDEVVLAVEAHCTKHGLWKADI